MNVWNRLGVVVVVIVLSPSPPVFWYQIACSPCFPSAQAIHGRWAAWPSRDRNG
ncbi:hypothetical protein CGRA01v4_00227 [Colletotrichum graminicola]|nr:hypothetical protein CGRA01v4_00227 [Colletotrichum graminicola]